MASGAQSALPGGHELGDQLYYTGSNQSFESGDKLVHGQQGEVVPVVRSSALRPWTSTKAMA